MSEHSGAEASMALVGAWVLGWPTGAVRAAVAMKGWEWFVADTFGAPELGLIEAWGLFLLASFAVMHMSGDDKRRPLTLMVEGVVFSLLMSAVAFVSLLILVTLS